MKKEGGESKPVDLLGKAQVSTEYIMVISFALLVIIPTTIVFFTQANDINNSIAYAQARTIAQKMAETAEIVYYQGYPAHKTLSIYFPEQISSITFDSRTINFVMSTSDGESDVFAVSSVNITGSLSTVSGIKKVKIKAMGSVVNI